MVRFGSLGADLRSGNMTFRSVPHVAWLSGVVLRDSPALLSFRRVLTRFLAISGHPLARPIRFNSGSQPPLPSFCGHAEVSAFCIETSKARSVLLFAA